MTFIHPFTKPTLDKDAVYWLINIQIRHAIFRGSQNKDKGSKKRQLEEEKWTVIIVFLLVGATSMPIFHDSTDPQIDDLKVHLTTCSTFRFDASRTHTADTTRTAYHVN